MKFAVTVCLMLAVLSPPPTLAQSAAPVPAAGAAADPGAQRIDDVFLKTHLAPDAFSATYTEKMPPARLEGVVKQLKTVLGEFRDARKSTDPNQPPFDNTWQRYVATFTKGTDDVYLRLDSGGKIDGLIFREMHPL